MSLNVNLKKCYSVISTNNKDISKSYELLNQANYPETVEIERLPSKSTIQSLPVTYNKHEITKINNKCQGKHELVEGRDKQLPKGSALFTGSDNGSDLDVHGFSLSPAVDESVKSEYSKSYYLFKKFKDTVINSFSKRKIKSKSNSNDLFINHLFKNSDSTKFTESSVEGLAVHEECASKESNQKITALKRKSYYQPNVAFSGNGNYQLSFPKAQTVDKKGTIELVLAPDADVIPIRKDNTPEGLHSLSAKPPHKSSDLDIGNNSLVADVSSSSLNLNSTDNETPTEASLSNVTDAMRSSDESRVGFSNMYNSSDGDVISETEINNATNVPTRTTTQAATIIETHSACSNTTKLVYSEVPANSVRDFCESKSLEVFMKIESRPAKLVNSATASILSSLSSSSSSSSSESYCSILQSPMHMVRSSVEE